MQDSNLLSANATGLQPGPALQLRRSSVHLLAPNPVVEMGSGPAVLPLGEDRLEKCSRRDSNPQCPKAPAFETGVSANCTTRTLSNRTDSNRRGHRRACCRRAPSSARALLQENRRCAPPGTRTQNLQIKSLAFYQLN